MMGNGISNNSEATQDVTNTQTSSVNTIEQSGVTNTNEQTSTNTNEQTITNTGEQPTTNTNEPIQNATPVVTTATTSEPPAKPQPKYVHPFITMIDEKRSESEMIDMLQCFCGRIEVGRDSMGRPIYEIVDQLEFIAPVLEVFSYCANNGKKAVVQWLANNFVPLQVSYDNNFCYFECLKYNHNEIADIIVHHESFNPTIQVLENLINRNKYGQFKHCMTSAYLTGDLRTYRFTFMHYIETNQYENVKSLLQKISQRISLTNITDRIYPDPELAQAPLVTPIQPVEIPVSQPTNTNETALPIEQPTNTNEIALPVEQPINAESDTIDEQPNNGQPSEEMQIDDSQY